MKTNIFLTAFICILTLMACSNNDKEIKDFINVEPRTIIFDHAGNPKNQNQKSFQISSNIAWEIHGDELWVKTDKMNGENNATIQIQVEPNLSTDSRSSILIITGGKRKRAIPVAIYIRQEGVDPKMDLLAQIPDPEFKKYCLKFDTNEDGALTSDEIANITEMKINSDYGQIRSLEGISLFYNLESLRLSDLNEVSALDLSNSKLKSIVLLGNSKLDQIDLSLLKSLNTIEFKYH